MPTFLFDKTIFGPVYSRRLGVSLGVNLLPVDRKFCNFNCIYCECGWTNAPGGKLVLPDRTGLKEALTIKLRELKGTTNEPDTITFAGNGEPTIHPEFSAIIDDTIMIRNKFSPATKIGVLSNASTLRKPNVVEALKKVDQNIQKLDTGIEETFQFLNQPRRSITVNTIVEYLELFKGKLILQTMFLRGEYNGNYIDNTSEKELEAWLPLVKRIKPEYVMIYSIDREAPAPGLKKISEVELNDVAKKVEEIGVRTKVYV